MNVELVPEPFVEVPLNWPIVWEFRAVKK